MAFSIMGGDVGTFCSAYCELDVGPIVKTTTTTTVYTTACVTTGLQLDPSSVIVQPSNQVPFGASSSSSHHQSPTGTIAGGAIGGTLVVIVVLLLYLNHRRRVDYSRVGEATSGYFVQRSSLKRCCGCRYGSHTFLSFTTPLSQHQRCRLHIDGKQRRGSIRYNHYGGFSGNCYLLGRRYGPTVFQ